MTITRPQRVILVIGAILMWIPSWAGGGTHDRVSLVLAWMGVTACVFLAISPRRPSSSAEKP